MHFKMSSAKWRPFCFGLNILRIFMLKHSTALAPGQSDVPMQTHSPRLKAFRCLSMDKCLGPIRFHMASKKYNRDYVRQSGGPSQYNIKMWSYQKRNSHYRFKMVSPSYFLYNGNSYAWKNSSWTGNHIHVKQWDVITHPCPTSTIA